MNRHTNPHTPPRHSAISQWLVHVGCAAALATSTVTFAQTQANQGRQSFELSAELLYQLLIAEIQATQNDPGTAFSLMLDAAKRSQHPDLFRRAVNMALQSRSGNSALSAAREWAQAHPNTEEPYRYELQILLSLNRPSEITRALQNLIRATPAEQRSGVISAIPSTLIRATDKTAAYSAAQTALRSSLADRTTAAAAWSAMGRMSLDLKDGAGALAHARKALEANPYSPYAIDLVLDLFDNQIQESETLIQDFLNKSVTNHSEVQTRAALQYSRILIEQRRHADALTQLGQLIQRQPHQPEAWLLQGIVQNQQRQPQAAQVSLLRFLELAPQLPAEQAQRGQTQAYLQLAHLAEQRNDWVNALSWLDRIDDTTQLFSAQTRRASVMGKQGRVDEARRLIQSLPDRSPDDSRRKLLAEAQLLRDLSRYNDALEVYAKAAERFPDEPNYLYEQAMMAERAGQLDRMEVLLRRLIVKHPDFYHAYNALGYSFADRNVRLPEAKSLIQRALTSAPNNAYILDSLGWVEFRLGNHTEALRLLQQAYSIQPDAEIAAHLGEVQWVLQQRDEALKTWREGLMLDPSNTTLQETLKRFRVKP